MQVKDLLLTKLETRPDETRVEEVQVSLIPHARQSFMNNLSVLFLSRYYLNKPEHRSLFMFCGIKNADQVCPVSPLSLVSTL